MLINGLLMHQYYPIMLPEIHSEPIVIYAPPLWKTIKTVDFVGRSAQNRVAILILSQGGAGHSAIPAGIA
jgi:hypothetical protein